MILGNYKIFKNLKLERRQSLLLCISPRIKALLIEVQKPASIGYKLVFSFPFLLDSTMLLQMFPLEFPDQENFLS